MDLNDYMHDWNDRQTMKGWFRLVRIFGGRPLLLRTLLRK